MDHDDILARARHLHSDTAGNILGLTTKLRETAEIVVQSADRVERNKSEITRQNSIQIKDAQEKLARQLAELPGAADLEMKRASNAAISALSVEVGRIAQNVAGDAAAAAKNTAFYRAVAGMAICAVIFGGTGYGIHAGASAVHLSEANEKVREANARAEAAEEVAEKKANARAEAAEEAAEKKIAAGKRQTGWAATEEGQIAKKFFDSKWGIVAATCSAKTWEIINNEDGRWCVPKPKPLLGGDEEKYGWKIP